jgi:glycerol-3-phosphate dehydrogenase
MIHELLDLIATDPSLAEPLSGTDDYLRAEVVYAASHEGARHLDDVLTRRTRISIETFHRGTQSCEEAAELVRGVLDWSPAQVEREIEHYHQRVAAERESQQMPDDKTADAARMGARDVVPLT